jgi:hypothetical protein
MSASADPRQVRAGMARVQAGQELSVTAAVSSRRRNVVYHFWKQERRNLADAGPALEAAGLHRWASDFPASILIVWPQAPSVVDARRFGATANAVARVMATAITKLAQIRAYEP